MIGSREGPALDGLDAGGVASVAEEFEHLFAGVDCGCVEGWVLREELCEEAPISVAENQGATTVGELWQEMSAGALKQRAEGEVLGPAVDAGDGVEVGCALHRINELAGRESG